MAPANYIAYTAPINPPDASPVLTLDQLWQGLELKIRSGETFVGGAILQTDVLKTYNDDKGRPVTEREVLFRDGNRRVHETCVLYHPMKVEFLQKDGGRVMNIISQGGRGEQDFYMTYTFEWMHPECEGDTEALEKSRQKEEAMAKTAVESTIKVMRELVESGKIK